MKNKYFIYRGGVLTALFLTSFFFLFTLCIALFFTSCNTLSEENKTSSIFIRLPIKEMEKSSASQARSVLLRSVDEITYEAVLVLYKNDGTELQKQTALGTSDELDEKIFVFKNIEVGLNVFVEIKILKNNVLFWQGKSDSLIIQPGEKNSVHVTMRKFVIEFYVNATSGNDNYTGNQDAPFKTVQKAIDVAVSRNKEKSGKSYIVYLVGNGEFTAASESGTVVNIDTEEVFNLTIIAAGNAILNANQGDRVISLKGSGLNLTLENLKITGGKSSYERDNGCGIYKEDGELTINKCTISGNTGIKYNYGGGIYNKSGKITINDSIIGGEYDDDANIAYDGGGIWNNNEGEIFINNTKIIGNKVTLGDSNADGGGIYNNGKIVLKESTISGNLVKPTSKYNGRGAGIYLNSGEVELIDSIITENNKDVACKSGDGGKGVYNNGTLKISGSTKITSDNEVLMRGPNHRSITIDGELTSDESTLAKITFYWYPDGSIAGIENMQVLTGDESLISKYYTKFVLDDSVASDYEINSEGKVVKNNP